MNIIEAMETRRSVRSYKPQILTVAQRLLLRDAIEEAVSPFGGKYKIVLKHIELRGDFKPSTYGVIKGAQSFFLLGIGSDEESALSAGFAFEQVVLKAWQEGLGTCWIAATFKGSTFDKNMTWPEGMELKIISPVGVAAEKKSMIERITRTIAGSDRRQPFDKMFFSADFREPVSPDSPFREALELMRLAPSSTNSQPWRALVADSTTVHFYYAPKSPASVLDTGIGLCHFVETLRYNGMEGDFSIVADAPAAPDNWRYLRTFTLK